MNKNNLQSAKKRPADKSLCLVCGFVGLHKFFVSCLNSTVEATETSLIRLLTNVIGEEPCFSMGDNVCRQCFMFFNRLDTYQARANELFSHLRSRYRDTKQQYMGSQLKLSDQIYSSLSNIKKVKNGTSLNVCNELTVTVYHSPHVPNKSKTKTLPSSRIKQPISNGILPQKRKAPSTNNMAAKRLKAENTFKNDTVVKAAGSTSGGQILKKVLPLCKVSSNPRKSKSDVLFDVDIKTESALLNKSPVVGKESPRSGSSSRQSSDCSSESESETDSTKESKTPSGRSSSASKSSSCSSNSSSSSSTSISSTESSSSNGGEAEVNGTIVENTSTPSIVNCEEEDLHERIDSQKLAEAVLMQNSFANSLLDNFMSTSMWMSGGDGTASKNGESGPSDVSTEITTEALQSAVDAQHCKVKRLQLKNTGQSYINTKGKLMVAKRISSQDCSRCPLKCNGRLSEADRKLIFSDYWGLGDYDLQREYLGKHMKREEKIGPSGYSRTVVLYFLSHDGSKVQVCRQFFLRTLDVSEKASRIVLAKKKENIKSE